jgi:23S rRNA (cytidine1920-2'-O)/16S rRNA (cytidine1409-2'-O)-methyltransferase
VVRDERIHRRVLRETVAMAQSLGLIVRGLTVSPAPGPAGNVEFLVWLLALEPGATAADAQQIDIEQAIERVMAARPK